jgi:hypothetical protein
MLSMFKKSAPGAGFLDTTLRPTCFGIDPMISAESANASKLVESNGRQRRPVAHVGEVTFTLFIC